MRNWLHKLTAAVGLGLFLVATTAEGAAADEPCELSVTVRTSDTLAYQPRGDRCEGRYVARLSGTAPSIVSFTSAFQDYDLRAGLDLNVTWATPDDVAMHLRGRSLEPKIYYQMDTTRPASETTFKWPVDILSGLDLYRAKLGVVGFYRRRVGNIERSIHVPLRISQGTVGMKTADYKLLFRPGVQLDEVFASLAPIDADGRARDFILDEVALEQGFYPAERAFPMTLPDLPRPGLYHLTIAAEAAGSGTVLVEEFYFWHQP